MRHRFAKAIKSQRISAALTTDQVCAAIYGRDANFDSRQGVKMELLARQTLRWGRWPYRQSPGAMFDTQAVSLYSTRTCWAMATKSRPQVKETNGLFVHSRDLYVLLSWQRRAGVSTGLASEDLESGHQRPTAHQPRWVVSYWGKFSLPDTHS